MLDRFLFEAFDNLSSIDRDIMVRAVENLGVEHDLVQICVELAARTIILVGDSLEYQVEPHFLSNYASVVFGDFLVHPFLQVHQVVSVLCHESLQMVSDFLVFMLCEAVVLARAVSIELYLPEVYADSLIGSRGLRAAARCDFVLLHLFGNHCLPQ
jgi:hypothetical protein